MRYLVPLGFLLASTTCVAAADFGGSSYDGSLKDAPLAAPAPVWSGLYLGGHAGWLTGGWDGNMAYSDAEAVEKAKGWIFDDSSKSLDNDSWLGGLQIGFNRQHGSVVWGLEADVSWADLNDSATLTPYPNDPPDNVWVVDNDLEYFGTVRGRIGFLVTPRLLLYGTGGLAWGKANSNLQVVDAGDVVVATGSASENHLGWAAGAGGEWMIANGWSLKAEWLHIDLGEEDYHLKGTTTAGVPHVTDSFPASLEFDIFRVGVNYNFGVGQ